MRVFIEDSFDAAHWLPNVPEGHKCRNMHGHTYKIRIEVSGEVGSESGWVKDYAEIRARWLSVKKLLDHKCLNQVTAALENPTCEQIAEYIGACLNSGTKSLGVTRIELRETEHSGVVWSAREGR